MCDFFINIATILRNKLPAMPNLYNTTTNIFKDFYINKVNAQTNFNLSHVKENFDFKELQNSPKKIQV